jgi:hypothetical protein
LISHGLYANGFVLLRLGLLFGITVVTQR